MTETEALVLALTMMFAFGTFGIVVIDRQRIHRLEKRIERLEVAR